MYHSLHPPFSETLSHAELTLAAAKWKQPEDFSSLADDVVFIHDKCHMHPLHSSIVRFMCQQLSQ